MVFIYYKKLLKLTDDIKTNEYIGFNTQYVA